MGRASLYILHSIFYLPSFKTSDKIPKNLLSLLFIVPPSATGKGHHISVPVGNSAFLDCPADGNPEPSIIWYDTRGTKIFSGKMLTFCQTKSSDSGCYTCSAKNLLGTVSITHCLVVGKVFRFLVVKSCTESKELFNSIKHFVPLQVINRFFHLLISVGKNC